MKLVNDDYRGVDPAKALTDFKERVAKYEAVYQPLDDGEAAVADHDAAFIKMVDAGRKLVVSHSQSRVVASKVLGLLLDPPGTAHDLSRWSARPPTTARACSAATRRSRRRASSTRAPSPPTSASASASCATRRRATRRGTGRRGGRRAPLRRQFDDGALRHAAAVHADLGDINRTSVGGQRGGADGGGDGGGDGGDARPALSKAKTAPPRQKRSTIGATSSEAIAAARSGELDGAAAEGSSSLPTAEGGVARQFSEEPRRVVVKLQRRTSCAPCSTR